MLLMQTHVAARLGIIQRTVISRLAAGIEDRVRGYVVAAAEPYPTSDIEVRIGAELWAGTAGLTVIDVDHGARAVEEHVPLGARQARLGREPRRRLQLEGAELVHLVVRDDGAPGLLAAGAVILVRTPKGRDGGHADEGELRGVKSEQRLRGVVSGLGSKPPTSLSATVTLRL